MDTQLNEITINGLEYVLKGQAVQSNNSEGLPYVIVRTYSAGAFAGYLQSLEGKGAKLINSRRLWKWTGAASLSELAVEGTCNPSVCKFPCEIPRHEITEAIEIIYCTEKARFSIASVPVWSAR